MPKLSLSQLLAVSATSLLAIGTLVFAGSAIAWQYESRTINGMNARKFIGPEHLRIQAMIDAQKQGKRTYSFTSEKAPLPVAP